MEIFKQVARTFTPPSEPQIPVIDFDNLDKIVKEVDDAGLLPRISKENYEWSKGVYEGQRIMQIYNHHVQPMNYMRTLFGDIRGKTAPVEKQISEVPFPIETNTSEPKLVVDPHDQFLASIVADFKDDNATIVQAPVCAVYSEKRKHTEPLFNESNTILAVDAPEKLNERDVVPRSGIIVDDERMIQVLNPVNVDKIEIVYNNFTLLSNPLNWEEIDKWLGGVAARLEPGGKFIVNGWRTGTPKERDFVIESDPLDENRIKIYRFYANSVTSYQVLKLEYLVVRAKRHGMTLIVGPTSWLSGGNKDFKSSFITYEFVKNKPSDGTWSVDYSYAYDDAGYGNYADGITLESYVNDIRSSYPVKFYTTNNRERKGKKWYLKIKMVDDEHFNLEDYYLQFTSEELSENIPPDMLCHAMLYPEESYNKRFGNVFSEVRLSSSMYDTAKGIGSRIVFYYISTPQSKFLFTPSVVNEIFTEWNLPHSKWESGFNYYKGLSRVRANPLFYKRDHLYISSFDFKWNKIIRIQFVRYTNAIIVNVPEVKSMNSFIHRKRLAGWIERNEHVDTSYAKKYAISISGDYDASNSPERICPYPLCFGKAVSEPCKNVLGDIANRLIVDPYHIRERHAYYYDILNPFQFEGESVYSKVGYENLFYFNIMCGISRINYGFEETATMRKLKAVHLCAFFRNDVTLYEASDFLRFSEEFLQKRFNPPKMMFTDSDRKNLLPLDLAFLKYIERPVLVKDSFNFLMRYSDGNVDIDNPALFRIEVFFKTSIFNSTQWMLRNNIVPEPYVSFGF